MAETDELSGVMDWLLANPDKKNTPEYEQKAVRFRELDQAPLNQPVKQVDASIPDWVKRPDAVNRDAIAAMDPGYTQDKYYNAWGKGRVNVEEEALRNDPLGRILRRAADTTIAAFQGLPGGSFLDELSALRGVVSGTSQAGYPGQVAYNRARADRYSEDFPGLPQAFSYAGSAATAPYMPTRPVATWAANTGLAALNAAGEGHGSPFTEEGVRSRGGNALEAAGITGLLGALAGPALARVDRYARSATDPAVEAAADRLGLTLPYGVRAADRRTNAEFVRRAQTNPGSPLEAAYEQSRVGMGNVINQISRGELGVNAEQAPWTAGNTINAALGRAAEGAGQASGALSGITNAALPDGSRADTANFIAALQNVVRERQLKGRAGQPNPAGVDPYAGLGADFNFATQPGGPTWEASNVHHTDLGQRKGIPETGTSDVSTAELSQMYAGTSQDRRNTIERLLGPNARADFEKRTAEQAALAEYQNLLARLRGNTRETRVPPAQQVANFADAGNIGRSGNLDEFRARVESMTPDELRQASAGVFGHFANTSQSPRFIETQPGTLINPSGFADKINRLTAEARAELFPIAGPGSTLGLDARALSLIGQRLGQVNALAGKGSAATHGTDMLPQGAVASVARPVIGPLRSALDALLPSRFAMTGIPDSAVQLFERGLLGGAQFAGQQAPRYYQPFNQPKAPPP
jgi:hypothetical protein